MWVYLSYIRTVEQIHCCYWWDLCVFLLIFLFIWLLFSYDTQKIELHFFSTTKQVTIYLTLSVCLKYSDPPHARTSTQPYPLLLWTLAAVCSWVLEVGYLLDVCVCPFFWSLVQPTAHTPNSFHWVSEKNTYTHTNTQLSPVPSIHCFVIIINAV